VPVGYLSESQAREYGCFPDELTPDQLARYFHLDDADRAFVALHRGDHNRLGVAVQLGSLRILGTFPEDAPFRKTPQRHLFRPCASPPASFRSPSPKS